MIDYSQVLLNHDIQSTSQLFDSFWNKITPLWTSEYAEAFPKHGEITLQNFEGFSFLIDHFWPDVDADAVNKELPETRVISFFGISNATLIKSTAAG